MILFMILMAIIVLLAVIGVALISVGGTAFLLIFGDIIICVLLVAWMIKKFVFKK